MSVYSAITLDHFQNPRNVGRLVSATGQGTADQPETETTITVYLEIGNGTIQHATFRAFGCSACIAASSMVTVLLVGRTLSAAQRVEAKAVDDALGGLPKEKRYCAELASEAARRAVAACGALG